MSPVPDKRVVSLLLAATSLAGQALYNFLENFQQASPKTTIKIIFDFYLLKSITYKHLFFAEKNASRSNLCITMLITCLLFVAFSATPRYT